MYSKKFHCFKVKTSKIQLYEITLFLGNDRLFYSSPNIHIFEVFISQKLCNYVEGLFRIILRKNIVSLISFRLYSTLTINNTETQNKISIIYGGDDNNRVECTESPQD